MKKSVSGPTRQDQPPVVSVASNERPLVMERKVVRGLADSGIMPPMKYWEIVADKLTATGWSWGHCSAVTRDGWRWIVDAHRKGRRYIVILTNCWTHSLNWKQCCCDCSSRMHLALWRDGSDAR